MGSRGILGSPLILPDHYNIGMMFPIAKSSTWTQHVGGALAEAAMLMAFDEINNKTDGVADDLLVGIDLRAVVRSPLASFTKGVDSAQDMLGVNGGEGVLINLGPYSFPSTQGNNNDDNDDKLTAMDII